MPFHRAEPEGEATYKNRAVRHLVDDPLITVCADLTYNIARETLGHETTYSGRKISANVQYQTDAH